MRTSPRGVVPAVTYCSVAGCWNIQTKRTWCEKHYRRWLKHGDPTVLKTLKAKPLDVRLERLTEKTDDCWEWRGNRIPEGYGKIFWDGKLRLAHRMWYEVAKGPIPEGLVIDHLCRNRGCVNPDHLEAVTPAENARRSPHCPTCECKR